MSIKNYNKSTHRKFKEDEESEYDPELLKEILYELSGNIFFWRDIKNIISSARKPCIKYVPRKR